MIGYSGPDLTKPLSTTGIPEALLATADEAIQ
jgi:hypothetical protein